MKYVTMTREDKTVDVKYWYNDEKISDIEKVFFTGNLDEKTKKDIRNDASKNGKMVLKFYEDTITTGKTYKYSMPEEDYFSLATKMDKRPVGDYISRTATVYCYNVTIYNNYTDNIEVITKYSKQANKEKALKDFTKELKSSDNIPVDCEIINTVQALYVMEASKFRYLAKMEVVEK